MSSVVLAVGGSRTSRSVVRIYLTGLPVALLEADSAEQALEVLRVARVHLIIADANVPGMEGLAFLRRLREDARAPVARLPVILLADGPAASPGAAASNVSATCVLKKPMGAESLRDAVEACLPPRYAEGARLP